MQRKTIERIISKKLNDWLDTIAKDNKELVNDVKCNILLSGGSITNLFMQKDVNDYDVYIKDMDVLLRLAEYYTKTYENMIKVLDGRKRSEYMADIPSMSFDGEKQVKNNSAYAVSVQTLKSDQIKLFLRNKDGGNTMGNYLKQENKNRLKKDKDLKYYPVFFSPNAISLNDKIQIVLRFHGDNEAIHKTFDFIHATNYFTFDTGLVTNTRALESIITKQLYYQGSLYPLTSIIRMKKFISRGWSISAGEILKIMYQISELDLNDPNVLEEQLIGVDVAYFEVLIDLIRDNKEHVMTSEYINHLIDMVFNGMDYDEGKE